MYIAANTRRPATGGRMFKLAEYFEVVFLEITKCVSDGLSQSHAVTYTIDYAYKHDTTCTYCKKLQ